MSARHGRKCTRLSALLKLLSPPPVPFAIVFRAPGQNYDGYSDYRAQMSRKARVTLCMRLPSFDIVASGFRLRVDRQITRPTPPYCAIRAK